MMQPTCPTATTLSAWLDNELGGEESQSIRFHLEACATCREQVLGWVRTIGQIGIEGPRDRGIEGTSSATETCLDPEALVAYSEAELTGDDATRAERHLQTCARCVGEVQRLIRLRVAIGESTTAVPEPARTFSPAAAIGWGARLRAWVESFGERFRPRWPALGALAATAVVILLVTRFVPFGNRGDEVQFRGIEATQRVEIIADKAPGRARPGENEPILVQLSRGSVATRLEESGRWTRIQLPDGRRVWVRSAEVSPLEGPTQ